MQRHAMLVFAFNYNFSTIFKFNLANERVFLHTPNFELFYKMFSCFVCANSAFRCFFSLDRASYVESHADLAMIAGAGNGTVVLLMRTTHFAYC